MNNKKNKPQLLIFASLILSASLAFFLFENLTVKIDSKYYYIYSENIDIVKFNYELSDTDYAKIRKFKKAKTLKLCVYHLSDISFLEYMPFLENLSLMNCHSKNDNFLCDIQLNCTSKCKNLKSIYMQNCNINDLNFISYMPNLQKLELIGEYDDLSLSGIENANFLKELYINSFYIYDLSNIEKAKNLQKLYIDNSFENSDTHVSFDTFTDISSISSLPELEEFGLNDFTFKTDLSPIKKCKNLKKLSIQNCKTETIDASLFLAIPKLETLDSRGVFIKNIAVLCEHNSLKKITISDKMYDKSEISALTEKNIDVDYK